MTPGEQMTLDALITCKHENEAEVAALKAECERLTASLAAAGRNFTRVGKALEQSQDALAAAKAEARELAQYVQDVAYDPGRHAAEYAHGLARHILAHMGDEPRTLTDDDPLWSNNDVRKYAPDEIRNAVLEEAAKICERQMRKGVAFATIPCTIRDAKRGGK